MKLAHIDNTTDLALNLTHFENVRDTWHLRWGLHWSFAPPVLRSVCSTPLYREDGSGTRVRLWELVSTPLDYVLSYTTLFWDGQKEKLSCFSTPTRFPDFEWTGVTSETVTRSYWLGWNWVLKARLFCAKAVDIWKSLNIKIYSSVKTENNTYLTHDISLAFIQLESISS